MMAFFAILISQQAQGYIALGHLSVDTLVIWPFA